MNEPTAPAVFDDPPQYGMRNALRAVLLFFEATARAPTPAQLQEWTRLTGVALPTVRALREHICKALLIGCAGDAGEMERLYGIREGHVMTARDVEDLQNLMADHNDELGDFEQYELGRLDGLYQAGGQAAVDRAKARDDEITQGAVSKAMAAFHEASERFKDRGGRGLK